METTTKLTFPDGETFEQFLLSLREIREMQRENTLKWEKTHREAKRRMKEAERRMEETDRQMKETMKETDRRIAETDRQMKESDQRLKETMKETDRRIGELSNRFGELAEHLVAPGIAEKFNALGYHFSVIMPSGQEIRDDKGKVIAEIDLLLENGDCIMAIEVKTRPRENDVEHHIGRLKILRKQRDKVNDKRKIYGGIAGAVFGGKEKQAAIKAGFFVLEQSGDTMKMVIPDNFTPSEW